MYKYRLSNGETYHTFEKAKERLDYLGMYGTVTKIKMGGEAYWMGQRIDEYTPEVVYSVGEDYQTPAPTKPIKEPSQLIADYIKGVVDD
jgi:hypothetical protein